MKANFMISVSVEVDPEKLEKTLNTQGMTANEATKVLRRRVFKFLDEEYSDGGSFGEYTREIQEDIEDAVSELGLGWDNSGE